ncbi:RES family NAD+ phosphorylase [Spirosoma arcticum]
MDVYRLSNARRADDLTGTGSKIGGGRWNYIGTPVLYTASSRALATLEVLVHSPLSYVPDYYRMVTIRIPEDSMQTVPLDQLPDGWNGLAPPPAIKDITEMWVAENKFLVLKVPSAVVAGEFNLLLNPAHSRFSDVRTTDNLPYSFDPRLTR